MTDIEVMSALDTALTAVRAHLNGLAAERVAMAEQIALQAAAIALLQAEIERLKNPAPPPVEPPADPPPAPAPAPAPAPVFAVRTDALSPANTVLFADWHDSWTYKRWHDFVPITGDTYALRFLGANHAANSPRVLSAPSYQLLVDGALHDAALIPAGANSGTFTLRAAELSDGWHKVEIAASSTETMRPWWVCVARNGPPTQGWMPVVHGSYDSVGYGHSRSQYAIVPAVFAPKSKPLPVRTYPHFNAPLRRDSLVSQDLVPMRAHDLYRPRITAGVLNTGNTQNYTWSGMVAKASTMALLDGPRGVGSVAMATHLQGGRNGKVYGTDPYRLFSISADGTIKTLAGYRHAAPAKRDLPITEASALANYELVGDWSAVPVARRGFHEIWGMSWDQRTLTVGGAAIDNGAGVQEQPHITGPAVFVADSQNNRVCRIEFSPTDHAVPAKVTEFITGLLDPWDCICADGVLYVAERMAHRIAAYDATTGAFMRVVVSGASGFVTLDTVRRPHRVATLDVIRAQPCIAPEGLYLQDGWLYFGSYSMAQIKRISLATGELQTVVATAAWDAGSNFFKISVSDGTFGPRGSVFLSSFSVTNSGLPMAYLPDGTAWPYNPNSHGGQGPGRVWEGVEYGCCSAVFDGRLLVSGSVEGVQIISRALPTDAVIEWPALKAAKDDYYARGLHLSHGHGGWGYYGLPLPWGQSALSDAHLQHHGWIQGD